MIYSILLLAVFFELFSCINPSEKNRQPAVNISVSAIGYDLSRPDQAIPLPGVLKEVSGITLFDPLNVACVQDENGMIFLVDIVKGKLNGYFSFHSIGDYEGITLAGNDIYVLRSDGELFQVLIEGSSGSLKKIFSVGIPPLDNEGLCYDRKNNRLLIVAKNSPGKDSDSRGKHPVYGFDLNSEVLVEGPVLTFDISEIKKFAADKNIKPSEGEGKINFRPSAMGIHPVTNKLYVLSALEKMLFVFNMNGNIEYIEKLNPALYDMPEGITFLPNGDMLISNEGRINPPTILRFNYKAK